MECLNPGGTGKDRAALSILRHAEREQLLPPPTIQNNTNNQNNTTTTATSSNGSSSGGIVVEGTSGSTGISLARLCQTRGHRLIVVMPDDQSDEKAELLRRYGAAV